MVGVCGAGAIRSRSRDDGELKSASLFVTR